MKPLIRENPIISFIVLTFGCSWTIWIVALLFVPEDSLIMWIVPGAYGPTVIAIVLTTVIGGKEGLKQLLSKFLIWRAGTGWYLVVLLLLPLAQFGGVIIYELLNPGSIGSFAPQNLSAWLVAPLLAIPLGPLAEELGWSGYLIPRMQGRTDALNSSIIVGLIWGLWHLPLFWGPFGTWVVGDPVRLWSAGAYILFTTFARIIYTWVYNNTRGSVLVAVLLHAVSNASIAFELFPNISAEAARLMKHWSVVPAFVVAMAIVFVYGRERLSRWPLVEGETMISDEEPMVRRESFAG